MILLKKLFHFLGGLSFAIFLIASTALFVVAGTLIESYFQSHRLAAAFSYSNPWFKLLLWGFFINILFSSLRRWPFTSRHIPFLITHFGLLMILSGVILKSYFGLQGNMRIIEGSGSHFIVKPNSYSLYLEKRDPNPGEPLIAYIPLEERWDGSMKVGESLKKSFPHLTIFLNPLLPHCFESYRSFIREDRAYINQAPPFPVYSAESGSTLPISGTLSLEGKEFLVQALKTSDALKTAREAYIQNSRVLLTDSLLGTVLFEGSMETFQSSGFLEKLELHLPFQQAEKVPQLVLTLRIKEGEALLEQMVVPLNGEKALLNINCSSPYLGALPLNVDIQTKPTLLILQNELDELILLAFNSEGQIALQKFDDLRQGSVVVYDRGFGGYATQVQFKFHGDQMTRLQREEATLLALVSALETGLQQNKILAPPIQLFQAACLEKGLAFPKTFVDFLSFWHRSRGWLLEEGVPLPEAFLAVIDHIDWTHVPEEDLKAALWLESLYSDLQGELKRGKDLLQLLREKQWPLVKALEVLKESERCSPEEVGKILRELGQQLRAVAGQLPLAYPAGGSKARLFTAYLQLFQITLQDFPFVLQQPLTTFTFESPLVLVSSEAKPLKKLEENIPSLHLLFEEKGKRDEIDLTYDPVGQGLKWPLLGEYLVRFQPLFEPLPYHLRLREARQVNYANSQQAYSYECDLVVIDRRTGHEVETTLSMNHVYETEEGYRFYLSHIASLEEAKEVQLTVNRDPTKYLLTYSGAGILSLGIFLLFWGRKRRSS